MYSLTSTSEAAPSSPTVAVLGLNFSNIETVTIFQSSRPISTISGPIVTIPSTFLSQPATYTVDVGSVLTGTCTTPFFAEVTDDVGQVVRFPQIGCSPQQQSCCVFAFQSNVSLSTCPADYSVKVRGTYTACCPSGFDLLYTGIGMQTPCYSNASTYLVPEESTPPNYFLIDDAIFSRSYRYIEPTDLSAHSNISSGGIAGIVLAVVLVSLVMVGFFGRWMVRHRRAARTVSTNVSDSTPEPPKPAPNPGTCPGSAPCKSVVDKHPQWPVEPCAISRTYSYPKYPSPEYKEAIELDIGNHPVYEHVAEESLRGGQKDNHDDSHSSNRMACAVSPSSPCEAPVAGLEAVSPSAGSDPNQNSVPVQRYSEPSLN